MTPRLRAIATETLQIIDDGYYPHPGADGGLVPIADQVAAAIAGSHLYQPDDPVPLPSAAVRSARITVTDESTLAATRRLGDGAAALVFASARHPGGGFLSGAQAQEESIARSSALYACQRAVNGFYNAHAEQRDLRYSDRIIFSPQVPVFRDDRGALLAEAYLTSFLTAAAPNFGALARNQPHHVDSVPYVLRHRARRILAVAAANQQCRLVLGAWGCGVFRNDPVVVADAFAHALPAVPFFDEVVFAIYDRDPGNPAYRAFAARFGA